MSTKDGMSEHEIASCEADQAEADSSVDASRFSSMKPDVAPNREENRGIMTVTSGGTMANSITYKQEGAHWNVFLEGEFVGQIKQLHADEFCYYPDGKMIGGDIFPTLAEVKQSLEGE